MESGDRGKNLMHLIQMMENQRITNFREIANGLLNMLKERLLVEFTLENVRFLWQVIIAGHQQEGNSSLLVFIFNNFNSVAMGTLNSILVGCRDPIYRYTVDCHLS